MKPLKLAVICSIIAIAATLTAESTWVEFEPSAEGQAPELTVLESSFAGTTINLQTLGMWVEDVKEGEETYQRITLPTSYTFEVGKPMLPVVRKLVAIPPTAGVTVKVEVNKETTLREYLVYPTQIPETDSGPKPPFTIDEEFYKLDTIYPVELSEVGAPAIMNDVRLVQLAIQPFRYNPKTKELTVATDLTVRLDYSGFDERNALKSQRSYFSPQWERIYHSLVLNFNDLYGTAQPYDTVGPPPVYFPIYYLIIYADDYRPEVNPLLQQFIDWKEYMGFIVDTINLNRIPGIIVDNPNPDDVYDVKEYIQAWHGGGPFSFKDYVLLVGDAPIYDTDFEENEQGRYDPVQSADPSHVPTYAGWIYLDYTQEPPVINGRIYSDYYYQLVAGDDDYPDLCIGRWCPESQADLNTNVNKVFAYERNPAVQWDCNQALLVSHHYYEDWDPLAYYRCKDSVDRFTTPWPPGYVHVPLHGIDAGSTNQAVINMINSSGGLGIINYRGHGYWGSWPEWDTAHENFDTLIVRNDLTNINRYPLVYNVCCANGCIPATLRYTYSPTEVMVEAWTRAPSKGAVAALGASRPSWTDENNVFDTTIFDVHFSQSLNCGMAINAGKVAMLTEGPDTVLGLANARMYYWIGDPTLDVWRRQPQQQAELFFALSPGGTILYVYVYANYTTPVPNAKVCLHRDSPWLHMVSYTGAGGGTSFPNPSDPAGVVVTATNQWGPNICIKPVSVPLSSFMISMSGQDESLPETVEWQLRPVLPNPFHSSVTVSYSVGGTVGSKVNQLVELSVFDVSGRKVKVLTSDSYAPGHYTVTWNGCDDYGRRLPMGVYVVRLHSDEFNANEKVVLLR